MNTAYLALGSNDGDRQENLKGAIDKLGSRPGIELVNLSPLYETAHIGPPAPDHLNCALEIATLLPPEALLVICQAVEAELGRDRANEVRWGARPIDIDISLFGDRIIQNENLIVPHPRLCERRFMLEPLSQIAGDVTVPGFNVTVKEILGWPSNQVDTVKVVQWTED